ncbi:MAG TPA: hypothetical protein VIW47_06310 [Nitrospiraceae bacterium]
MPNTIPGSQDEREREREREWAQRKKLLQAVLRYLAINGPTKWAMLYVHFDDRGITGEIGPALGHLAVCKHIAIEDTRVKITQLGMEQLKAKE